MTSNVKVSHVHLETPLIISTDTPQLLIIESPSEFYLTVTELDKQFNGEEGNFVFCKNEEIISPAKSGALIYDLFHFDLNDKKVLNLLYKKLEAAAFNENLIQFNETTAKLVSFIENISYELPFELEYDEPQPVDYFKASGLKFAKNHACLEEKIICYINALIELKNCEFFIFINLKSVLNDDKLLQIYKHCQKEQVGLLLIENGKHRPLLDCEKAIIITNDLCEILENYSDMV